MLKVHFYIIEAIRNSGIYIYLIHELAKAQNTLWGAVLYDAVPTTTLELAWLEIRDNA